MAGYLDTRQLIIDTLTQRPAGTQIMPEDHQAFALQITDYIRAVELAAGNSVPIAFAEASTVPVQPDNGQAIYLSQVNRGTTVTFTNFHDQNGNSIAVTTDIDTVKFVTLLWNGAYWSVQTTSVSATVLTAETMRVVITESSGTYSSSDSSSTINTAVSGGKYVYAMFDKQAYELVSSSSGSVVFKALLNDNVTVRKFTIAGTAVTKTDDPIVSISQNGQTGHIDINIGSDSCPVISLNDISKIVNTKYSIEIGGINGATGAKSTSSSRARTILFIDNTQPLDIRVSGNLRLLNYNTYNSPSFDDFNAQATTTDVFGGRFETGKYLVLVLHRTDNQNITEQDIENTSIEIVSVKTPITDIEDNVDDLAVKVGDFRLGRFGVYGLEQSTGNPYYVTTQRISSSFIDGRNNDIIVQCSGNLVLCLVYKYSSNSGAPSSVSSALNLSSVTLKKSDYGCWMRLLFKHSDNSDCSEADFANISIKSNGQSQDISALQSSVQTLQTNTQNFQKNDTPYCRPWASIEEHDGRLFGSWINKQSYPGYTHKVIPVNGGEAMQLKANSSAIAYCAIVKTYTEPAATGNTPYDLASGESGRRDIAINGILTITLPSDARYVIVASLMNTDPSAAPTELLIDGYEVINGVRKEIGNIKKDVSTLNNKLFVNTVLEQGSVYDATGIPFNASTRVRTPLIDGAFFVQVNSNYVINQIYKYDKFGSYIGVMSEKVPIGDNYEVEDSDYMYRIVFRDKNSTSTPISYTDPIISFIATGVEYEYGRKVYGFLRMSLCNEVESKIIPFVRGTDEDRMSYDTSKEYERLVVGFMTDNHIDLGNKRASYNNVKDAIDFYNGLHIPVAAILEGGDAITDIVTTSDSKTKQKEHLAKFFDVTWKSKMPFLFTKGNHDINTINVPPAYVLDDDDWGEIWFNRAETEYGIVRQTKTSGKKSGYYYYDLDAWKVRIICVDCFDLDFTKVDGSGNVLYAGSTATWIAQEQYDWIANTALNFDDKVEKDWGVIVFMHYYRTYDDYGTSIEPRFVNPARLFNDMLVAFNSQTDYNEVYSFPDNTFFNLNVSANFSRYANLEKKPYFISLITGHRHFDGNEVLDGINNILTANQLCGENSADIRLKRVAYTKTQNLFDTFVIDLKARTIRAFRFGAGVTCYGNGGDRFLPDGLSF